MIVILLFFLGIVMQRQRKALGQVLARGTDRDGREFVGAVGFAEGRDGNIPIHGPLMQYTERLLVRDAKESKRI